MFRCDAEGRFTFLNRAWVRLTGHPVGATLGRTLWESMPASDREEAYRRYRGFMERGTRRGDRVRLRLVTRDESVRTVEVSPEVCTVDGEVVGVVGTMVDITDQLAIEVEERHTQKLEAVGRLAAGIAHEINTPVQFVGDNLQFLDDAFASLVDLLGRYRRSLSPDSPYQTWAERQEMLGAAEVATEAEYLEAEIPRAVAEAREGAHRIASIVRAMKAFGHPDGTEQQAVDLNEAVRNTAVVARSEYKYVADLDLDLDEDLPAVVCHGGDVNQALLNLIVNAAHAIADGARGAPGRITVSTRLDGDDVVMSVADNGPGIPDEIRHRVFEPFFTTKDVGRGTGQGLALVRAVIDRHQGQVRFDTGPEGTTFTLRLPLEGTNSVTEAIR